MLVGPINFNRRAIVSMKIEVEDCIYFFFLFYERGVLMKYDILKKQCYRTGAYLKHNAPTILSGIGVVGVVTTTVMAVKATPKALDILEYREEEKGAELTKFEKVIATAPIYFPTVLMGTATISCILGANALNKYQQAMLTSAYAYLNTSYSGYKDKVKAIFGEDGERKVREEIAKDRYTKRTVQDFDGIKTFYDQFSGRYFESTLYDLQNSMYCLNRFYALQGTASLNDFYKYLNLPPTEYGEVIGWSAAQDWECFGYSWINVRWEQIEMPDGLECYALSFDIDPSEDYLDW